MVLWTGRALPSQHELHALPLHQLSLGSTQVPLLWTVYALVSFREFHVMPPDHAARSKGFFELPPSYSLRTLEEAQKHSRQKSLSRCDLSTASTLKECCVPPSSSVLGPSLFLGPTACAPWRRIGSAPASSTCLGGPATACTAPGLTPC